MSDDEMKAIYLRSKSLRQAAIALKIDQWKLRSIRDLLHWPKFSTSFIRRNGATPKGVRTTGASLYDAVVTSGSPLTQDQLEKINNE